MNYSPNVRCSPRQRGFTLVEALISLVVMAFGMLALSGMQVSLSRNADVAKQRTEAMRLAQARIEQMRSFSGISTGAVNWNGLDATANTTTTTNTTFTVASTMGGVDADAMRTVNVAVTWVDRTGAPQAINIASVISQTDPRDPGFIGNPLPLNTALRRPRGRNINIPIPAIDLGNGLSGTVFDGNYVAVYSNLSAGVVQICNPYVQGGRIEDEINAEIAGGRCETITGYIVAGYIGRAATTLAWPTGGEQGGINYASVTRNTVPTTGSYTAIRCLYRDATNQSTGDVITADYGYKYYICVIPLGAPFTWSGTVRLGGIITTSNRIVCRYQYSQTTITANERNVQPYVDVNSSIDEQNYMLASSNSNVTTSLRGAINVCPSSMTVAGVSVGVVHQDCRAVNANRATECPAPSVP